MQEEISMRYRLQELGTLAAAASLGLLWAVFITAAPLRASTERFSVPHDVALRIRLDDTLTSNDSQVGDPFSATVVDKGDYRDARVYGHIAQIDNVWQNRRPNHDDASLQPAGYADGRRAPIQAEIVELYHASLARR